MYRPNNMMAQGFILSRHWRDTPQGIVIELWLATDDKPIKLTIPNQQALFFIKQSDAAQLNSLVLSSRALRFGVECRPLPLKNTHGEAVSGVYCRHYRLLRALCGLLDEERIPFWESDIRPTERFLMERFVTSSLTVETVEPKPSSAAYLSVTANTVATTEYLPSLSVLSIDIETSMDAKSLYSIAAYSNTVAIVFMVDAEQSCHQDAVKDSSDSLAIKWCDSARDCLQKFLSWLAVVDPDVLIGWHVVQFDCWVLSKLCEQWNVPFTLGRDKSTPYWRTDAKDADVDGSGEKLFDRKRRYMQVSGRVVLDGIELLRIAFYHFDSFSLQAVANTLLGKSKLINHNDRGQAITDLFLNDKIALAKYNVQDCKLVWDIFEKTKLLDFAIARSRLTGLPLDKMGGSVASFEYAYLPKLHRKGYVAPNLGELQSDVISPGGYVMQSLPGLYRHVLVLDFKSLYPSIIRTFNIDPYAFWFAKNQQLPKEKIIEGYNDAFFARDECLLPNIIRDLWTARDQAKAENNQPLSQAIKIIMNSFYGVLGSMGCRFFDPRVCSSITLRGHDIMQQSQQWIEQQGFQVIYGDTDSLFVWLGKDFDQYDRVNESAHNVGQELAASLNVWWQKKLQAQYQINSELEIEFETHYQDFFMPTIRGSEAGSKKRYAGVISHYDQNGGEAKTELVFKGLETVRSDWTPLAKTFQQELYLMIFQQQPYREYIIDAVQKVRNGESDDALIYTKRLRRFISDYEKTNPPHVKAAKKVEAITKVRMGKGDRIDYVVTVNGPEPVQYRQSAIDYQHYIDKQLKPIADSILCFLNDSFEEMVQKQMNLL